MIFGPRRLLLIALGWIVAPVLRALWRVAVHADPDRPAALVALAARHLAAERPEWAQAMLAEIPHIRGTGERWRFAVGCLETALLPPDTATRTDRALRVLVALGGLACILAALYAATRAADRRIQMQPGDWVALSVVLVIYALVGRLMSRSARPAAQMARRLGLVAGLAIGSLMIVGNSPASPLGNLNMDANPRVGGAARQSRVLQPAADLDVRGHRLVCGRSPDGRQFGPHLVTGTRC